MKPTQIRWIGLLSISLVLSIMAGCGYAKRKDPAIVYLDTPDQAKQAVIEYVGKNGGSFEQNVCCGSMEPLIKAGDWVAYTNTPYSDDLKGRVVRYKAKWYGGKLVLHRLVSGNAKDGFIASGDNNKRSEPQFLVREPNYVDEAIVVFKVK